MPTYGHMYRVRFDDTPLSGKRVIGRIPSNTVWFGSEVLVIILLRSFHVQNQDAFPTTFLLFGKTRLLKKHYPR